MLQQALDFQSESDSLYRLLEPLEESDFEIKTQFKGWSINDVLQHLHYFNCAAHLSIKDEEGIIAFLSDLKRSSADGESLVVYTNNQLEGVKGRKLLNLWRDYYLEMIVDFHKVNPKMRVKWAGPDMSVLSSITARLMETWSHAQAVYDLLGVERVDSDHIKNIVIMGNNTFNWTFINRGEDLPNEKPFLKLTAPSMTVWELNEPSPTNFIEGLATEFCQVVTQTRHIKDTGLAVVGETASRWMAFAQCFAGPPRTPPSPGTRHLQAL